MCLRCLRCLNGLELCPDPRVSLVSHVSQLSQVSQRNSSADAFIKLLPLELGHFAYNIGSKCFGVAVGLFCFQFALLKAYLQ